MANLETILSWFETGDKPTQEEFKQTFSSFRHKDTKVPIAEVDGLESSLNNKLNVSDYVKDGKIRADKIESLDLMNFIESNEKDISEFAANSDKYEFQQNDFIAVLDEQGNFSLYLFKGGEKSNKNNYLPIGISDIPSGDYIPLTGTEAGKPVTGELEIKAPVSIGSDDYSLINTANGLIEDDLGSIYIKHNQEINLHANDCNFKFNKNGISSDIDFSDNVEELHYVQKKYVDNAISSVPTGGDLQDLQSALLNKADLVDGKVPTSQLPSYVDDVLEFANLAAFPNPGETGKIYIALNDNKLYRWTGSTYIEVSSSSITTSGNATQVSFFSSSTNISSDSNLTWDNSNKRLGVGVTTSPTTSIDTSTLRVRNLPDSLGDTSFLRRVVAKTDGTFGFEFNAITHYPVVTINSYTDDATHYILDVTVNNMSSNNWSGTEFIVSTIIGNPVVANNLEIEGNTVFGMASTVYSTSPYLTLASCNFIIKFPKATNTSAVWTNPNVLIAVGWAGTNNVDGASSLFKPRRVATSGGLIRNLRPKQNLLTNPITGTGVNSQVSFFNGTSTQTSDSNLIWDNSNKRLAVGVTSPTTAIDTTTLRVRNLPDVTSDSSYIRTLVQKADGTIGYHSKSISEYISLSGTEVNKPVTGDILFSEYKGLRRENEEEKKSGFIGFEDGNATLSTQTTENGHVSRIASVGNSIEIGCSDPTSRGLVGQADFTSNIQDLDYVQKKYVDSKVDLVSSNDRQNSGSYTLRKNDAKDGDLSYMKIIGTFDFSVNNFISLEFPDNVDVGIQKVTGKYQDEFGIVRYVDFVVETNADSETKIINNSEVSYKGVIINATLVGVAKNHAK